MALIERSLAWLSPVAVCLGPRLGLLLVGLLIVLRMATDRIMESDAAVAEARRVTWVGFWINAALGVLKVVGGILGRSSALVADGVHSLSDFVSDIIVIVMIGVARKLPDRRHEFGHGKYESLATLILALILGAVAVGLFVSAVEKVIAIAGGAVLPTPQPVVIAIVVLSIVLKEWLFRYTRRTGERIRSAAVVANAWHHRSDAFSSVAALAGVVGAVAFGEKMSVLDPIAAMVVAVFILGVAVKMGRPALGELLGASLSDADREAIVAVLDSTAGVVRWHRLRTFKSGKDAYVEVHLKVDPLITVRQAHDIATQAEQGIAAALSGYDTYVTTHIEPAE